MSRLHASVAVLLCSSCLFHFDRTLAPGELRGTAVIRSSSGALVAAANAVATLEGSTLSITADSHGVFAFEGLPAGTYSVDVRATSSGMGAADFGLHLRNIAIASADGADLGQIVLGAFGGLQGTVTLENTPVAAATVVIPGITQTPVTNGTYQLGVLLPGTYQLSVFLPDNPGAIESSLINVQVNPGKTTQVPTIALSQSELQTTGAAQGIAQLSGATSSADIDIQFSGAGPDLSTNPQGQYSGMNIPAGLYSVTASLGGFQSVTLSNIVIGGATTTIPMITLFPGSTPPADAGSDAGPVDAGEDAGPTDAGPSDAGPDAGPDAGATDAGVDAGEPDAGLDAGELDAGLDAGELDAGLDAGELDAGLDGGAVDGGALFPPGAPTNVMAVAGDGSATVTWTAPLDDGGDPILNYTVTSSPDGITVTVDGDQTNAQLTGLTDGTSYTFTVHATNAIGNSSESDPSAAVTPLGAPQAPFGVTAVAGDTVATVSWSAPLDDGGSPITGYTVTSTPGNMTATTSGATTVQVTGLIDGQSYTFTVHATNVIGDSPESAPSTAVTPLGPPSAPNGVMAVAGEMVATVTWSVPSSNGGSPITGYTVTAMPGSITASTTGATSAQVTGLTDGLSYTFTVHATNAIGNSPESTPTSGVIPMGPPLAPTGVSAVSGDTVATVSWTAPASDGGSMITSYTVTSTPDGITATANGDATSVQVTGLMDGTSYTFTVHATNAIGDSPESDPSTAVTPAGLPGAPTDVSAVFGNGSATVSWTPPASDGGSPITGYTVTSTPDGITASTTGATTVQVLGLTNGQSYTFTVHSTNSVGDSAESTPSTAVTPAGPPGAPTSVVAVAGPESATLTWNAPTDDGGSPVVTYTIIGEPGDVTAMTSASEPTAFVPELTDGVSYTFTVFATNAVGNGAESDPSAPVTPMGPPGAPLNVMAVAGDSVATVSWSAPASDGDSPITGYTVTTQPGGATTTTTDLSVQVTGLMDGQSYAFTVHATNSIGDGPESDPSNEVTPLYVDAGPPPPDPNVGQDDAGNAIITYTRIPWGSAATAGVPSFSVSGVSGSAAGDYGVVIFDNPDAGANVLGSATVDDTGAFTAALTSLDHPSVYIAGVSDAGVLSPDLQEVQNVTWTATFGGKVPGVTTTNPHVLTTTGDFIYEQQYESFGGPLVPDGLWAREASSYAGVTAPDDGQVLTEDAVSTVWTNLTPGPGDRWGASSAFDSTAKNLVLFGGCAAGDGCTSPLTDTWFWGGQTWTNVSAELNNSPTGRVSAAMSYDPIHQQLVLFGGLTWSGNAWTGLGDTWVLASGGNGWVNVTPSGTNPTASAAAMVYDTVHQVILLQTPDSATWTWDGSSWTSVSAAANGPSPQRTFPGLAFDSVRGVAVLFGGCGLVGSGLLGCANAEGGLLNDTWVWDGTAWTQVATGNLPNQRASDGLRSRARRDVARGRG